MFLDNSDAAGKGGNRVPRHDPDVCGLDGPGVSPTCPACVAEGRACSAVAAELHRIAARFEAADRRRWAESVEERQAGQASCIVAASEFWAAGSALADLGLLLVRYMLRHRAEELRGYLCDALRPEFEAVAAALKRGVRR
jgi:hypothetical protein